MPIQTPEINTKVELDPEILTLIEEEGQVIVHCHYHNYTLEVMGIRVWKSTFLVCDASGLQSQLIKAFDICYQPDWYWVAPGETKRFTMIFEPLPKSVVSFTLMEIINQPGPFVVSGILRNNSDVYNVKLD